MAGILKRFKDIMAANINALLDKAEDPEKMIDQYLRDMESDLGKVKAETASIMADAEKAKRDLAAADEEVAKMQTYAEKALVAGNEEDARRFLARKAELTKDRELKQQMVDVTSANAEKMRAMHDKLSQDILALNDRKAQIKAKVQAAKTQEQINAMNESVSSIDISDSMAAFDRMEEKADHMLDEANARAELNAPSPEVQSLAEIAKKYEDDPSIDAELASLKAELGL